jgi:hypothetical protein
MGKQVVTKEKNKRVHSRTINPDKPGGIPVETIAKSKNKERELVEDIDDITQSKLYHQNYRIHEFEVLSTQPYDWYVWRYYPAAELDGKITQVYIDRPENDRQVELCKKKAEIMEKLNRNYIIYRPKAEQDLDEYEGMFPEG